MKHIIDKATVLKLAYKHAYVCLSPEVEPDDYSFKENDILEFAQSLLLLAAKACENHIAFEGYYNSPVPEAIALELKAIAEEITKG